MIECIKRLICPLKMEIAACFASNQYSII